jgi:hypothetical protein
MRISKNWKCCDKMGETEEVITNKGIHYAKLICSNCHHFLKWIPDPKITKENNDRNIKIDITLSKYSNIPEKQIKFLNDIKQKRFLTPSQFNYLNSTMMKYPV